MNTRPSCCNVSSDDATQCTTLMASLFEGLFFNRLLLTTSRTKARSAVTLPGEQQGDRSRLLKISKLEPNLICEDTAAPPTFLAG